MENSKLSLSAIKEFEKAVIENLTPLAKEFKLNFEQIDSCLFMLNSESITIKVYFPECHGYDVDVKIAPVPSREWYSPQETSIYWVGQFLGLGKFIASRASYQTQIVRLVKVNTGFLREALPLLGSVPKHFWEDLSLFVQEQISKENKWTWE